MSMVEWFEFRVPGRVICAEHCVDSMGFEMDRAGGTRVLVVTDEGVEKAGLVGAVQEGMESGSADIYGVFSAVPRTPRCGWSMPVTKWSGSWAPTP